MHDTFDHSLLLIDSIKSRKNEREIVIMREKGKKNVYSFATIFSSNDEDFIVWF